MLLSEGYAHYFNLVTGLKWHRLEKETVTAPGSYVIATNSARNDERERRLAPPRNVLDAELCNRNVSQKIIFSELQRLALCSMNISKIDDQFLGHFSKLVVLDLSCNYLTDDSGFLELECPVTLEQINLSGNLLTQIPRAQRLRRLRHVNLSHNQIISVADDVRKNLPESLISLNVAFNHLRDPKTILTLASLTNLLSTGFAGNLFCLDFRYSKWLSRYFAGRWVDGNKIIDSPPQPLESITDAVPLGGQSLAKLVVYFGSLHAFPRFDENVQLMLEDRIRESNGEAPGGTLQGKFEVKYSAELLGRTTELAGQVEPGRVEFNQLLEMKLELSSIEVLKKFSRPIELSVHCHLLAAEASGTNKGSQKSKPTKSVVVEAKTTPLTTKRLFSVNVDLFDLLNGEPSIGYLACVSNVANCEAIATEICVVRDMNADQLDISKLQGIFAGSGANGETASGVAGGANANSKKGKKRA